ncbi:transmembrane protein 247 [Pogona vitticeps]
MRLEFELAMLKRQHEENDKQRQHEAKMEHIRHQLPSRSGPHGEDQQLGGPLDPITEIELEKMRMEFELAKLRYISEENERQRQHERKIYEDKEKQRQHEEKMEHVRQRQGNFRLVSQKASNGGVGDAVAETTPGTFADLGKMRIELQLAMEVYLPEMNEKKHPLEQGSHQEGTKAQQQADNKPEVEKAQAPLEQKNSGVTEHLGLQVPRIVVSGAETEWSSSRLDLAIETELEKRRMEFELTRLKYEHDENERQRQHEEKMEQLRHQGAPTREEDNPEYASSGADNATDQTSAPDDLTEPPCTPNEVTDPLDIRDEETHVRTKPRVVLDNQHPSLANREGEMAAWGQIEIPNKKEGCDILAPQLRKMHLNMEIMLTKYRYKAKEKEKQRHEEKVGEICQQAPLTQSPGGGHHLFLPRDTYTLFLYCFIFTHVIYIVRELIFFLIKEHELYAFAFILLCVIKMFWK